ncbi:hypothetical protein AVEN_80812-1 [Araneus ventricosus]|uniref:Uncharacterized protein n=1 Tax=Araneus ventricosus TaxID=182803 RepID=A0A4Y2JV94_ARAVE|nr:hypothetical protein AVEN_80812-1 [Araneus ventricosus]
MKKDRLNSTEVERKDDQTNVIPRVTEIAFSPIPPTGMDKETDSIDAYVRHGIAYDAYMRHSDAYENPLSRMWENSIKIGVHGIILSVRQVVSLTAVAIATGYFREDPFRIGGIRRKSGFYYILGSSLRWSFIIRLLGFAAVVHSFPFGAHSPK